MKLKPILKNEAEKRGMNKNQLAKAIGSHPATISAYWDGIQVGVEKKPLLKADIFRLVELLKVAGVTDGEMKQIRLVDIVEE